MAWTPVLMLVSINTYLIEILIMELIYTFIILLTSSMAFVLLKNYLIKANPPCPVCLSPSSTYLGRWYGKEYKCNGCGHYYWIPERIDNPKLK